MTTWSPFPDQWAFLASVRRMQPTEVEALASEAVKKGQVIGVRMGEPADDQNEATPWTRPPSRKRPKPVITGPLPERGQRCPVTAAVCGDRGITLSAHQPDQATRSLPEPGVLQEAGDALADCAHATGHQLRRRSSAAMWRYHEDVPVISRCSSPTSESTSRSKTSAQTGRFSTSTSTAS